MQTFKEAWQWFRQARFGQFIHWGSYAQYGRGEQILFREHLDHNEYARRACEWIPRHFDAQKWAQISFDAGMRYAVLTTRHHDGFCLWDTQATDYSTAAQAAQRDFVAEYVQAFRDAGMRVGLYYSLADWRIPAYWEGAAVDETRWAAFREYVHAQVRELLTNYGPIDMLWFDGAWPRSADEWDNQGLMRMIRTLQPDIMVNNRLGSPDGAPVHSTDEGDFGTPENHITPEGHRPWEACHTSLWRLWGHVEGGRWYSTAQMLDMLLETAGLGGNFLLNVGPDADGRYPDEYVRSMGEIGRWMDTHGEVVYNAEPGDVAEFITYGRQIRQGNKLHLIIRYWHPDGMVNACGIATAVKRAVLLTTGEELPFEQTAEHIRITGLPARPPTDLFPVITLEFDEPPQPCDWARDRLWQGDPLRMSEWARRRGTSVWADGLER